MTIIITRDAAKVAILVYDDGIGIFNKIQRDFDLLDPRHALLEFSKGKLETVNTTPEVDYTIKSVESDAAQLDLFGDVAN
ncbi:MAG: hypothetical protein EXR43_01115 [Dehalococcoidia bacterium]|nr:hypothetical protein [Dehalococcoidia bacterium]